MKFNEVKRGRPRVGGSVAIHLRVSEDLADAIDTYLSKHSSGVNRQEAVRELVRLQLAALGLPSDGVPIDNSTRKAAG